jgi:hypothetical protein
LTATIQLIQF